MSGRRGWGTRTGGAAASSGGGLRRGGAHRAPSPPPGELRGGGRAGPGRGGTTTTTSIIITITPAGRPAGWADPAAAGRAESGRELTGRSAGLAPCRRGGGRPGQGLPDGGFIPRICRPRSRPPSWQPGEEAVRGGGCPGLGASPAPGVASPAPVERSPAARSGSSPARPGPTHV